MLFAMVSGKDATAQMSKEIKTQRHNLMKWLHDSSPNTYEEWVQSIPIPNLSTTRSTREDTELCNVSQARSPSLEIETHKPDIFPSAKRSEAYERLEITQTTLECVALCFLSFLHRQINDFVQHDTDHSARSFFFVLRDIDISLVYS